MNYRVHCFVIAALLAATTAACGVLDFSPPQFVDSPTVSLNPNATTPLAALVEVVTDEPSTIILDIRTRGAERVVKFAEMDSNHSLPLLGLLPGSDYTVEVSVVDGNGNHATWSESLAFSTNPLPNDLPPLEVSVSNPNRMEPGVTLLGVSRVAPDSDSKFGMVLAVDETGGVVWFYRPDHSLQDLRLSAEGTLVYIAGPGARADIVEVDLLGNVVRRWHSKNRSDAAPGSLALDIENPHHELFQMPSGNFVTLGTELRRLENYWTSETDPQAERETANVIGDVVLEFTRDGTEARRYSLIDILDPYRLGYGSLDEGWNFAYPEADNGTRDWAHANAVIYDPSDDSYIVSVRHQDALVKIGRDSGELVWILGNLEGWRGGWSSSLLIPRPFDMLWPYHTHAPELTPSGTLLVFDNGNFRVRPYRPKPPPERSFSRAVEYAIDTEAMTVSEVWSYGGPGDEQFFSPIVGDADWMPETGNVLVTDGGRVTDEQGRPTDDLSGGLRWARIVEVTHTTPAEKVFELIIRDEEHPEVGWIVYRAERLQSLYP